MAEPWQPIDTAPRDGTVIVGWCPDLKPAMRSCCVRWENGWGFLTTPSNQMRLPTFWMAIPEPPK
jgi:hypothetical protein